MLKGGKTFPVSNGMKKVILAVFVVTIIVAASFLVAPQKADAQAGILSCFSGDITSALGSFLGGIFGGGGGMGGGMGGTVPVSDSTTQKNTGSTASEAKKPTPLPAFSTVWFGLLPTQ